jgi:hypothetical protein
MGERLKDAAAEATETLKDSAERRGMTPDGLKEMASEVGGAFSNRMSEGGERGNEARQGSGAGGPSSNRMSEGAHHGNEARQGSGAGSPSSTGGTTPRRTPLD